MTPFEEWIDHRQPFLPVRRFVQNWIAGLDMRSWQSRSLPIEEESHLPVYEVRSALLTYERPGDESKDAQERIRVSYRVTFASQEETDLVDLMVCDFFGGVRLHPFHYVLIDRPSHQRARVTESLGDNFHVDTGGQTGNRRCSNRVE